MALPTDSVVLIRPATRFQSDVIPCCLPKTSQETSPFSRGESWASQNGQRAILTSTQLVGVQSMVSLCPSSAVGGTTKKCAGSICRGGILSRGKPRHKTSLLNRLRSRYVRTGSSQGCVSKERQHHLPSPFSAIKSNVEQTSYCTQDEVHYTEKTYTILP